MMLEKNMVEYEVVSELHKTGKFTFDGIDTILEKHKNN